MVLVIFPKSEESSEVCKVSFLSLRLHLSQIMMKIHHSPHKKMESKMIYRRSLTFTLFTFALLSFSISLLLYRPLTTSFAQLSSSTEMPSTQAGANQLAELEAARQQYLSVWNNTTFTSQFDVFIEEGTHLGYGAY